MIKWLKHKYFRWKLKKAIEILRKIDILFKKAGYSRTVRRRFWRDAAKDPEKREEIFKECLKE